MEVINKKGLSLLSEYSKTGKMKLSDKDGYLYLLDLSNIRCSIRRNGTLAKFYNKNPFTEENINKYIELNTLPLTLKAFNEKGARENSEFICKDCGHMFLTSWNCIQRGDSCPKCHNRHSDYLNPRRLGLPLVKDYLKKYNNIDVIDTKYISNNSPIELKCSKHGVFYKKWVDIKKSPWVCNECNKEHNTANIRERSLNNIVNSIDSNKYEIVGEYIGSHTKIKTLCKKCNEYFYIRPSHLRNGVGCPRCSPKSKGEEKVSLFLKKMELEFEVQKRFADCRGVDKPLPFDFYIPSLNTLIEYQGRQHYYPIKRFGGEDGFKSQKIRDEIKKSYALLNGFNFVEIPYTEFYRVEHFLASKLKDALKD